MRRIRPEFKEELTMVSIAIVLWFLWLASQQGGF